MRPMIATVSARLNVAGRRYSAEAGETIEAVDSDVGTLERYGFRRSDGEGDDPPGGESTDLDDATLAELRRRAGERQIEGRSKMDREELLEALRTDTGQEA